MTTGAFRQNMASYLSKLKLVTDNLLIYVAEEKPLEVLQDDVQFFDLYTTSIVTCNEEQTQ